MTADELVAAREGLNAIAKEATRVSQAVAEFKRTALRTEEHWNGPIELSQDQFFEQARLDGALETARQCKEWASIAKRLLDDMVIEAKQ